MASVRFDDVGTICPGRARAVEDLDLEVEDGEFMVLVGPSGCGKTTALRMVARPRGGLRGRDPHRRPGVNRVPSKDRGIAMVFQSYALYPHLKVYDNIAFGLRAAKMDKAEIDTRVRQAAQTLGLPLAIFLLRNSFIGSRRSCSRRRASAGHRSGASSCGWCCPSECPRSPSRSSPSSAGSAPTST
jgi:ABC-type proline/glycine betaine transport system ATPase subunit